jgi:hypothetical protein
MGRARGNATEAARLAGYGGPEATAETLAAIGAENLRKPKIAAAIRARQENDPAVASREERQRFWTTVMRGGEGATLRDRLRASELLAKSGGDFIERRDLNVKHAEHGGALLAAADALAADLSPVELARLYHERIRGGVEPQP